VEPENAAVYLRQAQSHPHHRPPRNSARLAEGAPLPESGGQPWQLGSFVGTKRQAKEAIEREAGRCNMPYVSERWLGGTLTNYRTIRDRLKRLQELEGLWLPAGERAEKMDMTSYMKSMLNESGKYELSKSPETAAIRGYSKKMVATLNRELTKITRNLQGIREMNRLPDAMVVVDPKREDIAVKEAQRMGVTVLSLIDTDSDPDTVDLPIPAMTTVFVRLS